MSIELQFAQDVHEIPDIVTQVLYSMPLPVNLFPELIHSKKMLEQYNARLRVMVDHPSQIQQLEKALAAQGEKGVWSIFLKLDIGTKCVVFEYAVSTM